VSASTNKSLQGKDMAIRKTCAAILLLLVPLLGACAQARPPSENTLTEEETPAHELASQTIVVALSQAPVSLDPADHRDRTTESVIRNLFDGLVTRDTRNGVHLELAEELHWLDDQTLEVKLREGVLFHDGVEMTADDVIFTFNRIIQEQAIEYPEPHSSPRRSLIGPLESVDKVDRYTVVMHFNAPWPPAMQLLVHQQIVPKHYIQEVGTKAFLEHPIGTGPFKFVSASPRLDEIVLERFEDYYGGAPDLPPVGPACANRVMFRAIPDSLTRAAALVIGEVDIIQGVPLALIETLVEKDNIQVKAAPGTQPKWMEMNVQRPPFDDARVRRALNYAVDKERIVKEVYDGQAVALPGPLSPFNNYVDAELEPYPYDPTRAVDLLVEAGWTDSDDDGFLDQGDQRLAFALDTLQEWLPLAEAVADQLQRIGVRANVRTWDQSIIRPQLLDGQRLAYLDDWGDSAFDPVGHFEAKWHGYVEGQPYGRANYSGYNNERVNQLIVMGERTADPVERQEIYDEAQQIIYEEAPAVFLILPEEIEAASTRIQNWEPASDSRINLHDVCVSP
jgi:peptide/nickel transport system substrate-binding protein